MKKLLILLTLIGSAFGTTAVTGHFSSLGTTSVTGSTFVRFWLRGCGGNQPRINGTAVIAPSQGGVFFFDLAADSSGNISGTLYSTRDSSGTGPGDIECGGSQTSVWYGMQMFRAGKGGPETPIHANNTGTVDISNITPITTNPVVAAFSGDSVYARLDAGNQPFTGSLTIAGNIKPNVDNSRLLGDLTHRWVASLANTTTQNLTVNGAATFSSTVGLNGVTTLCNASGVYLRGECYADLPTAIASSDCPATGCTIDMSSPGASHALGVANTGSTKTVKVVLGPSVDYTIDHFVCTSGFDLGGFGSNTSTVVTSVGTNTQPVGVALQQNTYNTGCHIHDLQFNAASGNTSQQGLFFDVSTLTAASLQSSMFENLTLNGFKGTSLELKGRPSDALSAIQGDTFRNIQIYQPVGRVSPAVRMTGYIAQTRFETFFPIQCGDTLIDCVYIGPNTGTGSYCPSTSQFLNWSPQKGSVGIHIGCSGTILFDGGFAEGNPTVFSITQDSSTVGAAGNVGINIRNYNIAGTSAATAVLTDTDSNSRVFFNENVVFGSPGAFINGANASNVSYCNNVGLGATLGCTWNSQVKIGSGIAADGAGFKHKRVTGCTTGATSGNTCTTTVTWTTAFADANYTPVCTLLGPATLGHLAAISTDVIAAASVKVETVTDTNAAIAGTVNCVAVHD